MLFLHLGARTFLISRRTQLDRLQRPEWLDILSFLLSFTELHQIPASAHFGLFEYLVQRSSVAATRSFSHGHRSIKLTTAKHDLSDLLLSQLPALHVYEVGLSLSVEHHLNLTRRHRLTIFRVRARYRQRRVPSIHGCQEVCLLRQADETFVVAVIHLLLISSLQDDAYSCISHVIRDSVLI